jgi:uncharacterized membrane protein
MFRPRTARLWMGVGLLTIVTLVVAINAVNLCEAYGDGPPYYSRTTNMDKWTNPMPVVAVIDVMAVAVLSACFYWIRRSRMLGSRAS